MISELAFCLQLFFLFQISFFKNIFHVYHNSVNSWIQIGPGYH